jgi:L-alanine-DL-glutamate epimerase-like enolase superfamily enzyme
VVFVRHSRWPRRRVVTRGAVIVGGMPETHVGIAAATALASASDAATAVSASTHDLDGGRWLMRGPVEGGVVYEGRPRVRLGEALGTGITGLS